MAATICLPDVETTARRAAGIRAAWAADPEMPETAGCMADAVKVMAVRAAVYEATGDEAAAALPAPDAVELSVLLLTAQFDELPHVQARTGHPFLTGDGRVWEPGGHLHRVYREAFGQENGRYWPA